MIKDNIHNIEIVELSSLSISRETFFSNSEELNEYFAKFVSQDEKRSFTKCFVLIDINLRKIIGFYTLAAIDIPVVNVPKEKLKKEIRYPKIPAVLIGRLAIDRHFERQGYGKFLIADAIHRVKGGELGVAALVVDAKDEQAVSFYEKLGFIRFYDTEENKLFYPLTNLIHKK